MKFRLAALFFIGVFFCAQAQVFAVDSTKVDDELYMEFAVLRVGVDELKGLVTELRGEVTNSRAELAYLQDSLSRTSESLGKMMEQKAALQRELDELEARRRREQNALNDVQKQITQGQQTQAALKTEMSRQVPVQAQEVAPVRPAATVQAVPAVRPVATVQAVPAVKPPAESTKPVIDETTLLRTIYFGPDATTIGGSYLPYLNEIGKKMVDNPDMKIAIRGYSNAAGTPTGQRRVSQERAEQTAKYLQQTFRIAADRIVVEWVGADKLPFGTRVSPITRRAVQLFSLL